MLAADAGLRALDVGTTFAGLAGHGTLLVALPIAAAAGLVSFFSPCVVPLLPGYLSYVTGISAADLERGHRGRLVVGAVLFVLGFTLVFAAGGLAFGALGAALADHARLLNRILGALTILLGIAFIVPFGPLQRDLRVHKVPAVGIAAAPLLGILFGLGWTPCLGPTLAAVLNLALTEGTATRGAVLTVAYGLGLGIPFVIAALAYRRLLAAVTVVRRHQQTVVRIGGGLLIVVGILLVTGWWAEGVNRLQVWVAGFGTVV